jgi:hypothetical protein
MTVFDGAVCYSLQRGLARVLDPFWMVRAPHFSVANEASRGQELCRQSIDNDNSGDVVQVCISPLRIIFTVTSCYCSDILRRRRRCVGWSWALRACRQLLRS